MTTPNPNQNRIARLWSSLNKPWQGLVIFFTLVGGITATAQLWEMIAPKPKLPTLDLFHTPDGEVVAGNQIALNYAVQPATGQISLWGKTPQDHWQRLYPSRNSDLSSVSVNKDIASNTLRLHFNASDIGTHQFVLLWTAPDNAQHLADDAYPNSQAFTQARQALAQSSNMQHTELTLPVYPAPATQPPDGS